MMHQQHIGLGLDGRIDQRLAGGDAADDAADLRTPLDLQAIGAVIIDTRRVKKGVSFFH